MGPSGCGKTTLAELLVRFRDPVAGDVTLGGVDVRDAAQDDVRAAVLPRRARTPTCSPARSPRTSLLARPGAGAGETRARPGAGRASGRGSRRCPTAWPRTVGEHGAKVSGGQRRRIAAARAAALARRASSIADEPAAHLDASGAAALIGELAREARAGRGVLVIAHEPHGLECFDKVFTLRAGRLD